MKGERRADLAAYQEWLRQRRVAPEHMAPYFARWVERFLRMHEQRPHEVWQDTLEALLEDLGEGGFEPWQVRQAADAVTMYCGQFRKDVWVRSGTRVAPKRHAANAQASRATAPDAGEPPGAGSPGESFSGRRVVMPLPGQLGGQGANKSSAPGGLDAVEEDSHQPLPHPLMLAEMRRLLRLRHYAASTERSYLGWARRFLQYVRRADQHAPTSQDVQAYLTYLAVRRKVSASTQSQAFHAVLFLCRHVLMVEGLDDLGGTVRARQGAKLPVVLTQQETRAILAELKGRQRLMLELMYGGGLRVGELVRLRVKDLDFDSGTVTVRSGKGDKDRVTFLPKQVVPDLKRHLAKVKALHARDLAAGTVEAPLPGALRRKYPNAAREWGWQFVFPSRKLVVNDEGTVQRWHVAPATLQKAMKEAVRRSGIAKPASCHSMRHSFATALLMKGADIRRVQDLLGHKSVETTMIYTHVLQSLAPDLASPLDDL